MLYIVNETTFNGYSVYNLDMLHIIAILFGILVIISKNPIVSVLFLIGLFLSISGYLILTGLNFIGLAYLLVYIGAVSILFLFILMLINVRISELLIDSINSIPLAILLGSFFNYFVNNVLPYMVMTSSLFYNFSIKKKLTNVTSVSWDGYLAETSHITSIGNILYGSYSIWLIITSVILLLAMVGCIVITLKEQKVGASLDTYVANPLYYNLQLQSKIGLFTSISNLLCKLKIISTILLSRAYLKYLTRKLFTIKSLCIVVSSIVIANIVRYFAIKYGIDTPLLYHPVLFSSATGISSFLSISSKTTIEMIFSIFGDKQLAVVVGEHPVVSSTLKVDPNLKMVNSNSGQSSGQGVNVQGQGQGQGVNVQGPRDVTVLEHLNNGYVGHFRYQSTRKVFIPIDSDRLNQPDCYAYLAYLLDEYKDTYQEARDKGWVSGNPYIKSFGIIKPRDQARIRELIMEVRPAAKVGNLVVSDRLINLLWDRSPIT